MCAAAAKGLAVRATAAKGLAAQATAAKGAGEWPEANACASVDLHPASHRGGSAAGGAGVRGAGGGRRGASAASTAGRALRLPLVVVAPSRPDRAASLRIRTSRGSSQVTSQSPARALTRRSAAAPCWWDPEGPDARVLQAEGTCSPHWSSTPSRTGGARKRVRHIAREASFGSRRQRNFASAQPQQKQVLLLLPPPEEKSLRPAAGPLHHACIRSQSSRNGRLNAALVRYLRRVPRASMAYSSTSLGGRLYGIMS